MTAWAALEREARVSHTACGDGRMVWRAWGAGTPLVLLHGGAGSWRHWVRTIAAFRGERMVVAPDLPGLGESADVPEGMEDGGAAIVAAGLAEILGDTAGADLVGFSFGGSICGMVARRLPVRSLILVGSGGLGVIRGGARLERVRDKEGAERDAAHRTNLHRWMIADPSRIDAEAVAIQDWNSRHARFDSRAIGTGDVLVRVLPSLGCPISGIWGEHDHAVQGETDRPRAVLQSIQPGSRFTVVPGAGHWVAYEAPDAFNTALRDLLTPSRAENRSMDMSEVAMQPLAFEDVEVGQEAGPMHKGPFTTAHLMRWSAAMENWHKIHYDLPFATGHDKLPGLLVNGSLKQQLIAQLLKDWAGPTGWVWKIRFQFRAMNLVGERLQIWARISRTERLADYGLVDLDLGIRNGDGIESTPGSATVALPFRGGKPLPYPFVPAATKQEP